MLHRLSPIPSAALRRIAAALSLALLVGATVAPPAARANDRLARVEASGQLRVCIWPDYYGISYRNPRTQQLGGLDIENAHELAKALGVTVRFVDSAFARFIDDLLADRCDIAMFGIGVTAARQEKVRFTQPYLASDVYAVTTKANRSVREWADLDRPGVVLAVVRGTLYETVLAQRMKSAKLHLIDSPLAREQEVQSGRADAFVADYPYTRRLLDNSDWARIIAPPAPFHPTPYAWALAPGDDRFHARVERVLAEMKADGRLAAQARRHGLDAIAVLR